MTVTLLVGAIGLGTILLYGCLGEILTEKSGNLNLGIPGIMCVGTAGGCFGVSTYMNMVSSPEQASWILLILIAVLGAALFAAALAAIYAFVTVSLRCNQNVTGLTVTIFGSGFSQFFMDEYVDNTFFARASILFRRGIVPVSIPENFWASLGQIFLSHGVLVYFAIVIAVVLNYILKRTKIGLNLRAVGENPATADAMGINVTKYKFIAICVGGAIAGIGGLFYVMDFNVGSWENATTIESYGWLAIALVIFTLWKPNLAIFGSFLFGALFIAPNIISNISFSTMKLFKLLPYVVTLVVLIVTSILGKKNVQPPASLGINYFREER